MRRRELLAGLGLLLPFDAKSAPASSPDRPQDKVLVQEEWEDLLLLEAIRYLGLTGSQLEQMAALAESSDASLTSLHSDEQQTLAVLGRIASKQRQELISGRPSSVQEQRTALGMGTRLQQQRARAEEKIVNSTWPPFARVLSREQLQRAYLLTHGEPPVPENCSPALLDPAAGFIMDNRTQLFRARLTEAEDNLARARADLPPADLSDQERQALEASRTDLEANLRRAQDEVTQLRSTIQGRAQQVLTDPNRGDREAACRFLTRRLFTSARLRPLLQELTAPMP
jgi:hypothetical protein